MITKVAKKSDPIDVRVRAIIGDTFCINDQATVTLDAKLIEDLGADSMDIIELIMCLEEEFGFEAPEHEMLNCQTVRQIVYMVKRLMVTVEVMI